MKKNFKAGFLGLIGQPNAGKSSLLNFLVKEKVSIVTSKPQTTRRRIMGVWTADEGQIVFVDAPGLVKSTSGLNNFLEREAHDVIRSSDAVIAVLSLDEATAERNEEILDLVAKSKKPWIGIVTKTDLKDMEHPLYDSEMYTTENVRDLAEEIIREKCFESLNYEVPYQIAVQIRKFDEEAQPCPKIYADIMVSKDSHKPIVIGKGAENIKKIGQLSRKEIEALMGEKIFLDLKVTVKENWFENKQTLKELKYVVDSE